MQAAVETLCSFARIPLLLTLDDKLVLYRTPHKIAFFTATAKSGNRVEKFFFQFLDSNWKNSGVGQAQKNLGQSPDPHKIV